MSGAKHITVANLSCWLAVIWGAFVLNPYVCTFAKNPKIYAPMAEITPYESIWGAAFVALGIVGLIFSYAGKRKRTSMMMAIVFIFTAALFFLGDVESQGWGIYGAIGLFNFIQWQWGSNGPNS
jgi:hypothetical protein